MNDPDLFFLHALLCGEQGRRPVFPAKEAAERAFAPRPWEEIVELFQRPVPGLYKRAAMSEIQASFGAHPGHRGPPKARGACGAAIRPGHMARRESRGQSLLHYLFYRRIPGHVNQRLAFMNKKIDEISGEAQKSIPAEKQLRPAALSVLTAGFETDIII